MSQKVPTFKLSATLSNVLLESVWNLLQISSHLRRVATLPREIKKIKFSADIQQICKKMQKIAFYRHNFVTHPQMLIFSVFKIASFTAHWLQIKFSMSLFFYSFNVAINLWHRKFVTADVVQQTCLSIINMVFSDEDKILIKTHKYTQNILRA